MSLISLPSDYLRLNRRLPFGVYDAKRNLLVAPGQAIDQDERLATLRERPLFVDESEAGPYAASFQRSAHELVHKNATLEMIASAPVRGNSPSSSANPSRGLARGQLAGGAASAASVSQRAGSVKRDGPLTERVGHLVASLSLALRDANVESHWLERVESVLEAATELVRQQADGVFYLLIQRAAHTSEHYSATHGLLCALIAERAARTLGWDDSNCQALVHAALTMDASIATMQDSLVEFDNTPRPNQQAPLKVHGQRSAELLSSAGVTDALWLTLVRQHHAAAAPTSPALTATAVPGADNADRCGELLATVEAFVARLHRRGDRTPVTPIAALRATCMNAEGQLSPLGITLVKSVGMYPPGSYVRLTGGELGVVFAGGRRMNTPMVAVFLGTSGLALNDPLLRDTGQPGRAVIEAVPADKIKVQVQHERVLNLR